MLRYGAYAPEVIERLRWMTDVLGPLLQHAVRAADPVDVKAIIAQMVQMGDEGHNRNRAGTLMFLREVLPAMIDSGFAAGRRRRGGAVRLGQRPLLPQPGDAGLQAADPAPPRGIPGSTVVTVMARNGTDFGIQISGTGDTWFTAPGAAPPRGCSSAPTAPTTPTPTSATRRSPRPPASAGWRWRPRRRSSGSSAARCRTRWPPRSGCTTSPSARTPPSRIPILEFRGAPTGIDVTAVVRTGVLPQINTGMAGRVAGTGQVGAGLVTPPMACFTQALRRAWPPPPS